MPVVRTRAEFDASSGNWLERVIFNHRWVFLVLSVVITAFLGLHASRLQVNASFEKMIPKSHPYILNYLTNKAYLAGAGNAVRIAVENTRGDIYDPEYLQALQKINDTVYLLPGVDRGWMRGLWTTSLRWTEVTEEGLRGGPVMPDHFDGSPAMIESLRGNVARAGIVGSFVSQDMKSSMIVVPLVDINPDTGQPFDYAEFARELEAKVRPLGGEHVKVHIVGFAKLVGDLIDGLYDVMKFFAVSALIAALFVYFYTRCIRSTVLLVLAAQLGVVWLLGLMELMGYQLDPYLVLVPFLVYAIGLSHGAQKMNGVMQDVGRGTDKYVAARYTFRRLFLAGLTALLTNVVGFAVLIIIDIPVIRDMAFTTSVGVTVLVFTKLVLIPVMLSYIGVSPKAALRSLHEEADGSKRKGGVRDFLVRFTEPRRATMAVLVAAVAVGGSLTIRHNIQFGDLDKGAPELRPDSRYNKDVDFVNRNYGLSGDQFVVMLKTPGGDCIKFDTFVEADRLAMTLAELPGVLTTFSTADGLRMTTSGLFEGSPKWLAIPRNLSNRNEGFAAFSTNRPELADRSCFITPVVAYLADHKAQTLDRVVQAAAAFSAEHSVPERDFQLAAGSAGIDATTNIVVRQSFWTMHFVLYGAVTLLCYVTFRSWRAVVVALVPLIITSILCEALMVLLGIGIKVATLPVIAVGVGVGVDYALYLLSVQLAMQRSGQTLAAAYGYSLDFTGRIVGLVGLTMAAGVVTWAWSPIKFQADMGLLLTFMFLWNMVGALVLIPALSHFLLRGAVDKASTTPGGVDSHGEEAGNRSRREGTTRRIRTERAA
jgi:predicted RND superfamily exporter protein